MRHVTLIVMDELLMPDGVGDMLGFQVQIGKPGETFKGASTATSRAATLVLNLQRAKYVVESSSGAATDLLAQGKWC